jgi:dTDP-4-dehydrorhamnose reductase
MSWIVISPDSKRYNKAMKILVTGIHGQVGFELLRSLEHLGTLILADRSALDLSAPHTIRAFIQAHKPNLIVHPAAYTAVDRAEQEPELCQQINAASVAVMADEAAKLGAAMILFSTDYVFDGTGDQPRLENDPTGPLNVYGASKLAGEQALARYCPQHLILRTSWVYSLRGTNFLLTMLKLSQEKEHLRIVNDQIGAPTWSRFIAERTADLITRYIHHHEGKTTLSCSPGVIHLTPSGATSWAGFAAEIFRLADRNVQIEEIPSRSYPMPAQRPYNSRLDISKLEHLLGASMPSWEETLNHCLKGESRD